MMMIEEGQEIIECGETRELLSMLQKMLGVSTRGVDLKEDVHDIPVHGIDIENIDLEGGAALLELYVKLYKTTKKIEYLKMACGIVSHVHNSLGKFRPDDWEGRSGYLGGSAENVTVNGLRSGIHENEPKSVDFDDRNTENNDHFGWKGDGQTLSHLTKWIRSVLFLLLSTSDGDLQLASQIPLDELLGKNEDHQMSSLRSEFLLQSCRDLGLVLATKFIYRHNGVTKICFKRSINLERVLISECRTQDFIDVFVTLLSVKQVLTGANTPIEVIYQLENAVKFVENMLDSEKRMNMDLAVAGEVFSFILNLAQLMEQDKRYPLYFEVLLEDWLRFATKTVRHLTFESESWKSSYLAEYRNPRKELIFVHGFFAFSQAVEILSTSIKMNGKIRQKRMKTLVDSSFTELKAAALEVREFWSTRENQQSRIWMELGLLNLATLISCFIEEDRLKLKC